MSVFRFHTPLSAPAKRSRGPKATDDAQAKARIAQSESAELRRQVDRMQLICEAIWTIVKERVGADDEELFKRITRIDLRDGKLDGRSKKPTQRCSDCKRVVSARTGVCLYCGAVVDHKSLF
jgi:hypothetical protein